LCLNRVLSGLRELPGLLIAEAGQSDPEARFDELGVNHGQGVLGRQASMRPISGIIGRLHVVQFREQTIPFQGGLVSRQNDPRRAHRRGSAADVQHLGRVSVPVCGPSVRPARLTGVAFRDGAEIRRIEIVFPGNSDQREQRISPRIGEGSPHPMRGRRFADRADRPVRGDPFARRMRQRRG
jgi:hypothetical protein